MDPKEMAVSVFQEALKEADPFASVIRHADTLRSFFATGGYKSISYLAFGKAAPRMAQALESAAGDITGQGMVITSHGSASGFASRLDSPALVFEAGHPVLDNAGLDATAQAMDMVSALGEKDLLVCLVSGGGSAMLASPSDGITIGDKQSVTEDLLRSGADITEVNTVRRHLSRVKGGKLAALAQPAGVFSLIISDVVGDEVESIASGPTAPDPTTCRDALEVLRKYGITPPDNINNALERCVRDTPKPGDPVFEKVMNVIAAGNLSALKAAFSRALELGLRPEITTEELRGDVSDAARWLAGIAREDRKRPACLISGGETTVRVTGNGKGGRNMELALRFIIETEGMSGVTLLSAGTDGMDGPTEAAGAIVDEKTFRRALKKGLDLADYLKRNDSYGFFDKVGGLFVTGTTGTNVMDIQVMLLT
jgi:glycerate-2-kinase